MSNQKILLSVCVPTYNRPAELRRFLEILAPQITGRVEIVIGDDGDEDGVLVTKSILNNFPAANITYFKNPYGRGAVQNIIAVTERASGYYIWWFGDDDTMTSGAVERTLKIIEEYPEIDFIWSNYVSFPQVSRLAIDLKESRFFRDSNEILETVASHLGLISTNIFKRGLVSPHALLDNALVNTGNFNLYIVMQILAKSKASYYMHEPGVINYPQTTGDCSYNPFQTFAIDYYVIVKNFEKSFKKGSIRKMIGENFKHVWRAVLVAKARGDTPAWVPPNVAKTLFKYYWSYLGYWIAFPFLLMPQRWVKIFYSLFKFLRAKVKRNMLLKT